MTTTTHTGPANTNPDSLHARWILLAGLAVVILHHLPALTGTFTSDSFTIVRNCAQLAQDGALWQWLLDRFWHGLEVQSRYYRPLSSASLCVDYLLFGARPLGWHGVQLGFHLLNGWLLYRLALGLAGTARHRHAMAALAALLFWFSPAAPEVSVWIAGRYNVLALLFMLLALLAQLRARPFSAALCLALALCSKESAMVLPALLATLSWWRHRIENGPVPGFSERGRQLLRELWPAALVFAAYLALRWYLFGDVLGIYPQDRSAQPSGLIAAALGQALQRLDIIGATVLPAWRDAPLLMGLFWAILATATVLGAISAWQARRWRSWWALPMVWLAVSVVALLPHLHTLSSAGQGARLLYNASAWLALALTLPWAERIGYPRHRWYYAAALAVVILTLLAAQYPAQRDWNRATHYQQQLLANLATEAATLDDGQWALVMIPDHLGVALVGRNAQGALVLPPFQEQILLHKLVPFVPQDLETWRQRLQQGITWPSHITRQPQDRWPSKVYCADPVQAQLIPLPQTLISSAPDAPLNHRPRWRAAWQLATAGRCGEEEYRRANRP